MDGMIRPTRRALLRTGLASAAVLGTPLGAWAAQDGSLDAISRRKGLQFGTAISAAQLRDDDLTELVREQCSVLVAENAFKWKHIEPREGALRLDNAKAIAAFARANDLSLRGHTLSWNQDNRMPDWLLAKEATLGRGRASKMGDLLTTHIRRMIAEFPGVASWDVVNEAILLGDGSLRNSLLTRTIGPEFIDIAFATAREAAPAAQMVYNDYMSWGAKPEHRDGVLRMLDAALGRGVRIDAIGIQSHLGNTVDRPIDEVAWRRFLETIEGMGLDILITELDCGDRNVEAADIATRDARTAAHVKAYLDLTLSFRRVRQIVLWGISDRDSYMNSPRYEQARRRPDGLAQRGHVYDAELRAKPMRDAIVAAIEAAPPRA